MLKSSLEIVAGLTKFRLEISEEKITLTVANKKAKIVEDTDMDTLRTVYGYLGTIIDKYGETHDCTSLKSAG